MRAAHAAARSARAGSAARPGGAGLRHGGRARHAARRHRSVRERRARGWVQPAARRRSRCTTSPRRARWFTEPGAVIARRRDRARARHRGRRPLRAGRRRRAARAPLVSTTRRGAVLASPGCMLTDIAQAQEWLGACRPAVAHRSCGAGGAGGRGAPRAPARTAAARSVELQPTRAHGARDLRDDGRLHHQSSRA